MKNQFQNELEDVFAYLMQLHQDNIHPKVARKRLRRLQQQYPNTEINLLWEEESYDYSVHYDVLLRHPGEGTVSVSFCPDRALPWPMRGVHRWHDADLVKVNNTVLTIEQAIGCLDSVWDEPKLVNRLLNACLIQEELEKNPIELTDSELQLAIDGWRRAHRLYTSEDTYRWMSQRSMTHTQLEQYVTTEAVVAKLRDKVTASRIKDYFTQHKANFDTAHVAQFSIHGKQKAEQLYQQVLSGDIDFWQAAQQQFLAASQKSVEQTSRMLFAELQRRQMTDQKANAIFSEKPGKLLKPLKTDDDCYELILVLAIPPTCFDVKMQQTIKRILFEAWLAERRQVAKVEWYWGNADRLSQLFVPEQVAAG
ncbi:TIGR04500 family putative peptide maturation system protein [Mastigocoleus testarum]|uniref:Uncharacterized protein n=1 Tax=Mastigocoleus testarum BC008 TaxID=371196 RepID=A0A0V7ZBD4_9CYAN|nr:TIGR04500 family putative peptide maturation system protein [Mastigocoleus testarum]KST61837.1 hypothetical protein BC008_07270 [Mastigocoleus testarum BC008]KST69600.1 hypothetical protein BC008_04670 [Mastigocoleus testarum BC008]